MGFLLVVLLLNCDFLILTLSLLILALCVLLLVLPDLIAMALPFFARVLLKLRDLAMFLGLVQVAGLPTILPLRMPAVQR